MDTADDVTPVDPHLAELATGLITRVDELADQLADLTWDEIEYYRLSTSVSRADLVDTLKDNLVRAFTALAGSAKSVDTLRARENGRQRAAAGPPLPAVMDAYRVGSRFIWQVLVEEAARAGNVAHGALVNAASNVWTFQDDFIRAMADGYREEQTAQLIAQEQERSALVEALLEGRAMATATLWEAADLLRIGQHGPYVVVAAEVAQVGRQGLRSIDQVLQRADIGSAWRLMPDLHVGIVCLHRSGSMQRLLEILRRLATRPVGVSPIFNDLARTAVSLRLARIALTGSIPTRSLITVFDDDAMAVTAVATPEVTRRVANHLLAGLDQMQAFDRAVLLDTFEAWLDSGGSTDDTARSMFCHPNTVRRRLRRLEQATGKSLSIPRDLAELCLALEIDRRVPPMSGL